ncbi:MAG TPA: PQQ-binding-like beta-propeller repeat protein [Bacteroidales bacterium]|nr:PQQ-binding-like beta-propeller repeat protein [Bacteroidales bacterium]HQG37299.1 PQQ-binding-like beta-propeller repeat protein [Bacteroidales bacterium]HQG52047.1 PQQ-binding-like beta-propeller repeat protein [Bacteroidales bacterium]
MKNKVFIPVIVFLFCALNSCTQGKKDIKNWPQYLGPYRNSTSDQKGILRSWPEKGPEVLWTVDVGIGFGGPVIKDGKVYLLDRNGDVADVMRCFDFSSGKELWNYSYDAPGRVQFPGSRSVPAADGNYVYSCGHNGDLYCFDINTHKPVWHKNIWTDFGGDKLPIWAITQCPLVYGDLLIVLSQAPDAGAVAYNKLTGDVVWKTRNLVNESYASPSVVKIDGKDHIVVVISSTNPIGHKELPYTPGNIVGIEPLTGKILWEYNDWECHISVPSAVDAGNNRVLVAGGYEHGVVMLKVEKKPDGNYGVTELFKHNDFGDHTKPPILYNGYFYGQFSTNSKRDGLVCMNMDGKVMWKTMRSPLFDKGSMILVDGVILATDGNRSLYVIEPDPTAFKPIASAAILEAGQNWAPIALADGKLLIRDQKRLMCIRVAR